VTSPPEGRDGSSPSVAALAVQLSNLRREVEALIGRLDTVARAQREQAAVLSDVAELREQIEQVLSTLTTEDDASPAEWFWLTMTEQRRSEQFSELFNWVETVLRAQYPDYLADPLRFLAQFARAGLATLGLGTAVTTFRTRSVMDEEGGPSRL
jgi:hypothetical protein